MVEVPDWARRLGDAAAAALEQPGGDRLVLDALATLPHARTVRLRTGWFSTVPAVHLGSHRFRRHGDGRLLVEHVVEEVALTHATATPAQAGEAIAVAAAVHAAAHGPAVVPEAEAVTSGLRAASG